MTVVQGVILWKGRVLVPKVLQGSVLSALHPAHQGSTSMSLSVSQMVWWPGIAKDIKLMRELCSKCVRNTPYQPAAPPHPLPVAYYPFQMVSDDYFAYSGHTYLVLVDRYSGWPMV